MKCGREIDDNQAFCEYCLIDMELHPVKPGTVILLPKQETAAPRKPLRKKKPVLAPEEQLPKLKQKVWALRIIALLLSALLGVTSYFAYEAITELDIQRLLGQNYNTVTSTEASEEPTGETDVPSTT
jgi:hypothetical protein